MLKNKKILLGVTGSIAIYKSLELIRLLIKSGALVKVVMSESAKKFITPLTFETISQNIVLHEGSECWSNETNHIGYAKWADIFVIAPASANTINKLAYGIADNLLTQTALACRAPLLLAPSANTAMIEHATTQSSLLTLQNRGAKIISSVVGELACKDIGNGAMAEPKEIFYATARELLKNSFWSDKSVLITGGGTIERIDDVRFISNFSSGKMASELAKVLYFLGAKVTLLTSKEHHIPKEIRVVKYESTKELMGLIEKNPFEYLFMASAVSDFVPKKPTKGKIKKDGLDSMTLELDKNIDILSSLAKNGKIIGFKAELDKKSAKDNAKKMLKNKNLHAVCLNVIDEQNPFGGDTNEITIFLADKEHEIKRARKLDVAFEIARIIGIHGQ